MDLEKLHTFVTCSECKTFYEAADLLFISPSAVTKHISALERELKIRLFDRVGNGAVLTEEGKMALPVAKRMLSDAEFLRQIAENDQTVNEVSVLSIPLLRRFCLNEMLDCFHETYPDISLQIMEHQKVLANIIAHRKPIGLVSDMIVDLTLFETIHYPIGKVGVVVSTKHPLADRKSVSLTELADASFLDIESSGTVKFHRALCHQAGFAPNIRQQCPREDSLLYMIANSSDVALFSSAVYSLYPNCGDTCFLPLQENIPSNAYFVRLKGITHSRSVELFWNFLKEYYQ